MIRGLRALALFLILLTSPAWSAVAFDAVSESHTGTSGSASEGSFSWTHAPSGTPRGVLCFTHVNANADDATAVDYGASAMASVSGGRAVDTAGEPGDTKAWFLGSSVPTGNQTVTVTRNNNSNVMYASCVTVTASSDTEVYTAGIVLVSGDGVLAEANVDDGSPGTDSLRVSASQFGGGTVPPAGTNSTALISIDFGARTIGAWRETTAGQGSRPVGGNSSPASDDRAAVYLAIRETGGAPPACPKMRATLGVGC
jgi:hypothetical protein